MALCRRCAGPLLVLEYIEGESLFRRLARVGKLTLARTMAAAAQAADALHAGHQKGLVHGEVSPRSVLIRSDDSLVLTSFGPARTPGDNVSAAGAVIGETIYFSPEQALGEPVTYLSDIFTLGLVAYQCLAGRRPLRRRPTPWNVQCALSENPRRPCRSTFRRTSAPLSSVRWP